MKYLHLSNGITKVDEKKNFFDFSNKTYKNYYQFVRIAEGQLSFADLIHRAYLRTISKENDNLLSFI